MRIAKIPGRRAGSAHCQKNGGPNAGQYLCCELSSQPQGRPGPKRTKKGLRHFPPKSATEVDVGYRVSRFLRRLRELGEGEGTTGERSSPAPHIRRTHWHICWTGPRREPEKRLPVLCWIPPTPVGFAWDEAQERLLPTVVNVNS